MSHDDPFLPGRRALGRERHPLYYAMNPQADDKRLRQKTWHHYYAEIPLADRRIVRTTFRLAETTRINYRLPAGRAIFPVMEMFAAGSVLVLVPSPRLQAALPEAVPLRVRVVASGPAPEGRKTGYILVEELDAGLVARVIQALRYPAHATCAQSQQCQRQCRRRRVR